MKWLKYFVVVVFGVLLVACGTKQAEPEVQKAIDMAFQKQNGSSLETDDYYAFEDEASVVVYQDELHYYVLIKQPQTKKASKAFEAIWGFKKSDYSSYGSFQGDKQRQEFLNSGIAKEVYRSEKGN